MQLSRNSLEIDRFYLASQIFNYKLRQIMPIIKSVATQDDGGYI